MLLNEATVLVPELLPPMTQPVLKQDRKSTLEQYASEFLAGANNPHTRRGYATDLRHFLDTTKGDLSDASLRVYKELVIGNLAPRSANRRLSTVKQYLDLLVLKEVLDRNLYGLTKNLGVKIDRRDNPTEALEDAEVKRMLDHARARIEDAESSAARLLGLSRRLVLVLGFQLGLRREEMVNLRLGSIQGGKLLVRGKGSRVRSLALDESVSEELAGYISATEVITGRSRVSTEFLLINQKKLDGLSPIGSGSVNDWFQEIARECGIEKDITSHWGRATAITKLLEEDVPIRDAARFAGHRSLEQTSIYDKKHNEAPLKITMKLKY